MTDYQGATDVVPPHEEIMQTRQYWRGKRQQTRYIIWLKEWDEGAISEVENSVLSEHHYKRVALIAYWKALKEWDEEGLYDCHFVTMHCFKPETNTTEWMQEKYLRLWQKNQVGLCTSCQRRECPCEAQTKAGECRSLTKGTWFTYALHDPRSGDIRYIGMSGQVEPEMRLRQHVNGTAKGTQKDKWIMELKGVGMKPEIHIVKRWDRWTEATKHEQELIRLLPNLTNGKAKGST